MSRALLLALSFLTTASCTTLRTPSEGGNPWYELRSEHITLYTDLTEKDAIKAIRGFESRHHLLAAALFAGAPPPLHAQVIAFRKDDDFHRFAPESVGAFYTHGLGLTTQQIPTIVMHGTPTTAAWSIWQHELTHQFIHFSMGATPTWLNEGLAQYYSTARVDGETLSLGGFLPDIAFSNGGDWRSRRDAGTSRLLIPITQASPPSLLMTLEPAKFYLRHAKREDIDLNRTLTANYAGSWALVHMLISDPEYRERYQEFLRLVAEGMDADHAVCNVVDDLSASKLDADFVAYIQRPEMAVWRQTYEPPAPVDPRVTSLIQAHVLVLWAQLAVNRPGFERLGPAYLGEALSLAPKDLWVLETTARFAAATGDLELARTRLEEARKIAPTAHGPLLALITLYDDDDASWPAEQREKWLTALVAQLEPIASTASELNALAWYLSRRGRAEEALPLSTRALQVDPNCGACFDTHVLVLFELGELDKAVHVQRVAIDRVYEHASESTLLEWQARLLEYEEAARASSGPERVDVARPRRCWE